MKVISNPQLICRLLNLRKTEIFFKDHTTITLRLLKIIQTYQQPRFRKELISSTTSLIPQELWDTVVTIREKTLTDQLKLDSSLLLSIRLTESTLLWRCRSSISGMQLSLMMITSHRKMLQWTKCLHTQSSSLMQLPKLMMRTDGLTRFSESWLLQRKLQLCNLKNLWMKYQQTSIGNMMALIQLFLASKILPGLFQRKLIQSPTQVSLSSSQTRTRKILSPQKELESIEKFKKSLRVGDSSSFRISAQLRLLLQPLELPHYYGARLFEVKTGLLISKFK